MAKSVLYEKENGREKKENGIDVNMEELMIFRIRLNSLTLHVERIINVSSTLLWKMSKCVSAHNENQSFISSNTDSV